MCALTYVPSQISLQQFSLGRRPQTDQPDRFWCLCTGIYNVTPQQKCHININTFQNYIYFLLLLIPTSNNRGRGGEEIRPYESASEAIRNRHNHATLWQLECNSAESSFLRPPFLWNHQHCHKNYLLGAAGLSTINECRKTAILTF